MTPFSSSCWSTDQYEPLYWSNYGCRGFFATWVHLSPCDVNTIRHKDHFITRSSTLDLTWAIKQPLLCCTNCTQKAQSWMTLVSLRSSTQLPRAAGRGANMALPPWLRWSQTLHSKPLPASCKASAHHYLGTVLALVEDTGTWWWPVSGWTGDLWGLIQP